MAIYVWKGKLSYKIVPILFAAVLFSITQSLGQLLAQDVSEGPCLSWTDLLPHLYSGINTVPVIAPGSFYAPISSKAAYRQYAEGLLGRPADDQHELDSMQLIFHCGVLFSTIVNTGFPYLENPPQFSQSCVSIALPNLPNLGITRGDLNFDYIQATCFGFPAVRPDGSMAWRASPSFATTMDSIVWANPDSSVLLTYRCPADGIKDYKVVSKNKTLSNEDIFIIKQKIVELGFSEDNMAYMLYDD